MGVTFLLCILLHFGVAKYRNVEEIVNKHDGTIEYQGRDGWFQVDIVL